MAEAKGKSKKRLPKDAPATTFDPVSVEVKTLDTVVKLLASSERDVLLQALLALDGAAAKHPDSLSAVLELGATDPLLGLARHQDLDVRRFSMKLLAQLSRLEPARRRLLQDEALVAFFVRVLAEDDDVVAHEFSSLVLAELTADSAEAGELVMTAEGVFDALLLRTASPDPDVEHNCLQLMANLLRDPAAYEGFAGAAGFGFEPLLALLGSEYPAVQRLAARVSGALTARARDSRAHELFRRAAGVDRALDVLEKPEWEDLHQDVTQLLVHAAQDPDTAELVHRSGALRRLLDLADKSAATSSLLDGALAVVARVAALEPGRQALYGLGAHELLARLVRGGAAAACPGLALLARLPAALAALAALDPAPDLAQLLRGESRGWAERTLAAQALCELARLDRRFALALLRDGTQEVIVNLLGKKIPVELSTILIHCLTNLAMQEDIRSVIATPRMLETLLSYLEEGEAPCAGLAVAAMECLSAFALEGRARDWLLESGAAVAAIVRHLRHPSVPLAHAAAAALLQLTVVDHRVAAAFVRAGALQWMMDRPEMRALVPVWSAATDALLDGHLPSKLAFRGRLDVTDKTREGFYVPRHAERRFPVLEELLEDRTCPVRPVYVCYFERAAPPEPPPPPEQPADRSSGRKSVQNNNKKAASSQGQEEVKMSPPEDRSIYLTDPYLPEYLQQLQKTLTIPKEPQDASANRIEERARIVAQFVADQMSGRDPEEACDARQLELHLYQLKVFLETNVIPLGHLRVGTHLERAVLFKVLADRLGLPCALVRGPYGRSWVEVAVPQGDNVDGEVGLLALPTRLLRPNHIVDLMYNVGQLLPLHTYEADVYIGKPTSRNLNACITKSHESTLDQKT